jgi:hypothetical protein
MPVNQRRSRYAYPVFVMAGLVPAIHVFNSKEDVDARDKRGHDG